MNDSTKGPSPERRSSPRIPVDMWVEQATSREIYFQRSANISVGGIYLEHTIPHPRGTVIVLRFTFPDGGEPVEVQGEIVTTGSASEDLGMGIRFIDLSEAARQRIESYIRSAMDRTTR